MDQEEIRLQSRCFLWHWNHFPQYRRLLHANNNNSENKIKGNQNKAIGVVAGVSDHEYNFKGRTYFFEFKTATGTQSPEQKEFQERVTQHGFEYHIIRSVDRFKELITEIHLRA